MSISMDKLSGLSKTEALSLIDQQPNWSNTHIKHLLNGLKYDSKITNTSILKVGDVINTRLNHPGLIIKIKNNLVICCLMTSQESTESILLKCNSRFYNDSYLTSTIIIHSLEYSISRFRNVYDHKSDIILIKQKIKAFYNNLLT